MSVIPGISTDNPITTETETTLSGVLVGDSGKVRAATNSEIVTDAELTAALSAYLPLAGGVLAGLLSFSGTNHAGIRLNNLTTTQRNAITGQAGQVIWNTTDSRLQVHDGTSWTSGFARLSGDTFTGNIVVPSIRFTNVTNDVGIESIALRNGFVGQPVIINGLDAISRGSGLAAFRAYAAIGTNAIQVATAIGQPIAFNVDGSGNAFATALETRNATSPTSILINNTYTSNTNFERGFARWASNVFQIGTEKGSLGGSVRGIDFQTDGTSRLSIGADGAIRALSSIRGNGANPLILRGDTGAATVQILTTSAIQAIVVGGTTIPSITVSSIISYTAAELSLAATNNNLNPPVSYNARIAASTNATITGMLSSSSGRMFLVVNPTAFNITILHQSASSNETNRFICPGATDFVLAPQEMCIWLYDSTDSRWRVRPL